MKRIVVGLGLVAGALLALPAAAAGAEKGPYGAISAGYLVPMDNDDEIGGVAVTVEYDGGFALNGALGYAFGTGLRAELELGYGRTSGDAIEALGASAELDGAEVDIFTTTVNAFYDIETGTALTPYLGGGVGLAHTAVGDFTALGFAFEGESDTNLMALGEIGVGIAVADGVTIVPAYRFLWIDNGGNGFEDDRAHLFKIGARFAF